MIHQLQTISEISDIIRDSKYYRGVSYASKKIEKIGAHKLIELAYKDRHIASLRHKSLDELIDELSEQYVIRNILSSCEREDIDYRRRDVVNILRKIQVLPVKVAIGSPYRTFEKFYRKYTSENIYFGYKIYDLDGNAKWLIHPEDLLHGLDIYLRGLNDFVKGQLPIKRSGVVREYTFKVKSRSNPSFHNVRIRRIPLRNEKTEAIYGDWLSLEGICDCELHANNRGLTKADKLGRLSTEYFSIRTCPHIVSAIYKLQFEPKELKKIAFPLLLYPSPELYNFWQIFRKVVKYPGNYARFTEVLAINYFISKYGFEKAYLLPSSYRASVFSKYQPL